MSKLQPVRGTRDILGEDARRFSRVVEAFRRLADSYGFEEIITPVFEFTEVFKRTLGEASDVVAKEMYTFEDRGGDSLTLRPENTAGIVRAFLSEGMHVKGVVKLYAHGPMFRYERPQRGRFRQFHQLDAEILGAAEPAADVELVALGHHLLVDLGLSGSRSTSKVDSIRQQALEDLGFNGSTRLHLNTLGDVESRAKYRKRLVDYFEKHKDKLSAESRERLKKNPLRILDSKDEGDRKILHDAPLMQDSHNAESKAFFADVQKGLKNLGIAFTLDQRLVRGLDYYCHTAYEFITTDLGAQGTVIGGGRYDGLVEMMGGPKTPGTGWAAGIERLAMLLKDAPAPARLAVFVPGDGAAEAIVAKLCQAARKAGVACDMAFRGTMKKRLERANRQSARLAVLVGADEVKKSAAIVRDLDSGAQSEVAFAALPSFLAKASGR